MKNLRTIATLLVLTVMTFSCQTNDELVELETQQNVNKVRSLQEEGRIGTGTTTYEEVVVVYAPGISESAKQSIRAYEASRLGVSFQVVITCRTNSNMETWIFNIPQTRPGDGDISVVISNDYIIYWEDAPVC